MKTTHLTTALILSSLMTVPAFATPSKSAKPTPQQIIQRLKAGNTRFVENTRQHRDYARQIKDTKLAQHPKAVIVACMDSRNIPEIALDQGIGDVFTIRVAGNVINQDILGSIEYAIKVAGSKVIVVMGHTRCGAVQAACKGAELGNLGRLLGQIQPAVQQGKKQMPSKTCQDPKLVDQIAVQNVKNMMLKLQENSPISRKLIQSGQVQMIGALYDVSTGKVTFLP